MQHNPLSLKDVLLWSLVLPAIAGALQQHPGNAGHPSVATASAPADYPTHHSADELAEPTSALTQRWRSAPPDSLNTPPGGRFKDTQVPDARLSRDNGSGRGGGNGGSSSSGSKSTRRRSSSSSVPTSFPPNERALATVSPADSRPAVRALPPAKPPASTGGINPRQQARSLQHWQVEDIILLATVDGKIWARDRTTGAHRWLLEVDRPMVETVYHRHNHSVDERGVEIEDPVWIVEPSQDGAIYLYTPKSGLGMRRLGLTVKGLSEMSPFASDDYPQVVYTAMKETSLFTIDAATGNVVKSFTSSGSFSNGDRTCKRVSIEDSLEEDECEAMGTLMLGRTEYTIGIQDRNTLEQISTIRYFEWGPNNRDQDLRSKYYSTMDNKYVYTKHDGAIFGLDLGTGSNKGQRSGEATKPTYWEKFSSPVARVYDVVRPLNDMSSDASLVVLPQPLGPAPETLDDLDDEESIFVNCTEAGSWYALSKASYPGVTDGATTALWYTDDFFSLPPLPLSKHLRSKFTGLHQLSGSQQSRKPGTPSIGGNPHLGIDPPPDHEMRSPAQNDRADWADHLPSVRALLLALLVALIGCSVFYRDKIGQYAGARGVSVPPLAAELPRAAADTLPEEPTTEMLLPNGSAQKPDVVIAEDVEVLAATDSNEAELAEAADDEKDANKPKGHKRGKRGGKKQKEKDAQFDARQRTKPQPVEVITVTASESPQVSGPLQINSLVIHTDRVIGQGSCGTSVFEGSFEGREVAVKRMLSQYYELASQEVSFLQQSDDHPNVVRYFCQQKDDHFLYIAVELCQASLFEVWEADKARTDARQQQLRTIKLSVQQDIPRTLEQLAAGLCHLHDLRIIHRDIKPQNILVAFPKKGQSGSAPRLVISDFGLGKNLPENVSTLLDPTGNAGTSGWKAPELITQPGDSDSVKHSQNSTHSTSSNPPGTTPSSTGIKRAADIFSLGCLFFWVLTDGLHPFEDDNGWQQLRELNIKRDRKNLHPLARWSDAYEPMQLITTMLAHQPQDRPTAQQVRCHPFFWPEAKRLAFLCDVSDHFERETRGTVDDNYTSDSPALTTLESRAQEVIGTNPFDFLLQLDRHFVDTLGKQRKYSGNRLLDLLRALRNKKNHYEDMPEDVKRKVGPLVAGSLVGGYLGFWCRRFPRLLVVCHEVIRELGLEGGDRFRGYFDG